MAKQGRALPARRSRDTGEESLLLRSAESLGRMIGSLQRQLEGATKQLSRVPWERDGHGDGADGRATPSARRSVKARADGAARTDGKRDGKGAGAIRGTRSKSASTKAQSTADRTSKRASKAAMAKKTAGRGRSGGARKRTKKTNGA